MSFSLPTSIDTAAAAIPAIALAASSKVPRSDFHYESWAALQTAVAAEQANNTAGSPIWVEGTRLNVGTAPNTVTMIWSVANNHARLASFGSGKTMLLGSDTSIFNFGSGVPSSSLGANGDGYVDWAVGVYGQKAAGAWPATPVITFLATYPSNLYWRGPMAKLAAAKLRGPSAPPRIAFFTDSNGVGEGAGTGATYALIGARELSFPLVLAHTLGWQTASAFGDQNITSATSGAVTVSQYDPRITLGTGWGFASTPGFGGKIAQVTGPSSGLYTFAPESQFDRFTVWYPVAPTGYQSSVDILLDGVVVQNVSQTGTAALAKYQGTCTLGTHTISMRGNSASGLCQLGGIETRNSTSSAPILLHGGSCGAKMSDLSGVTQPWDMLNFLVALQPDVVFLYCNINDINQNTTLTTVEPQIDSVNFASQAAGADLINTTSWPFNNAGIVSGTEDQYANWLRANAAAFGGAFLDFRAIFGASFNMASTLRGLGYDGGHPNTAGHALMASSLARLGLF